MPLEDSSDAEGLREYFGSQKVLTQVRPINITDIPWILFGDAAEVCTNAQYGATEAAECPFWTVSVQLEDGNWLNVRTFANADVSIYLAPFALSVLTSLLGIGGSVIVLARKITRPQRDESSAAEQLGRGEPARPIPVSGPAEVAKTADAFNQMQERLTRFVRDRTAMLAAINHDLRTPITSLRLRAEFIEDNALRENMIETAEEMRTMVDSYLEFSRQDAVAEEPQPVDLKELLGELVNEEPMAALEQASSAVVLCRPIAIKRVFRNLIGNGVKYGSRVRVSLISRAEQTIVEFRDDGPGIPADMYEEVFTPFTRLDTSRDVTDGSVGLGLTIARSIVRKHGGDVFPFRAREEFGIRVVLPKVNAG
jgi:signal transduction histidine kinase